MKIMINHKFYIYLCYTSLVLLMVMDRIFIRIHLEPNITIMFIDNPRDCYAVIIGFLNLYFLLTKSLMSSKLPI